MPSSHTTLIKTLRQTAYDLRRNAEQIEDREHEPSFYNVITLELSSGAVLEANICAGCRHVSQLLYAAAKALQNAQ